MIGRGFSSSFAAEIIPMIANTKTIIDKIHPRHGINAQIIPAIASTNA